ncbi:MAG: hypothetical protein ACK5LK_05625, partial [Chthoniobacterales bacterium]
MRKFPTPKVTTPHPLAWLWEPLEEDPNFEKRRMFGLMAVYLNGKLLFCFGAKKEPWNGLLICTNREHHASLTSDFPSLAPHSILP